MAEVFSKLSHSQGVVSDAQKKALLLHTAGVDVQELHEALTDLGHDQAGNEPYGRHVFRSMTQQEGETVDQFVTKLRKQVPNCNFTSPNTDIRDQVSFIYTEKKFAGKRKSTTAKSAEYSS